jgi:hypothetical protein
MKTCHSRRDSDSKLGQSVIQLSAIYSDEWQIVPQLEREGQYLYVSPKSLFHFDAHLLFGFDEQQEIMQLHHHGCFASEKQKETS